MTNIDNTGIDKAKAFNISEYIEYSENGIISKQLHKRDIGNVTLFSFDKGQSLSEHTAPFDAIVQIIDGTAEVIINHEKHTVKTGEMIIMPANIPHAVNAVERFKMILTMMKG